MFTKTGNNINSLFLHLYLFNDAAFSVLKLKAVRDLYAISNTDYKLLNLLQNVSLFAQENRDLHEIIMTLRDERDLKSNEVKELKLALDATKDPNTEVLKNQVVRLTALVTKLERNLNAKQVFCETVVTENESLKNDLQSLKDDRILQLREMKKELGQHTRSPEVQRILNRAFDNEDGQSEVKD